MGSKLARDFSSIPSASGRPARLAYGRLQSAGKDAARIAASSGLTAGDIVDDHQRLDAAGQVKFLELAALELDDDCLGFHLARCFELGEIGLLYYVLTLSEQLSGRAPQWRAHSGINDESVRLRISFDGPVVIGIDYLGAAQQSDRQHSEFWIAGIVRICRTVTDRRIAPKWIKLRHFRAQTPPEFRSYLGCDIESRGGRR